MRRLICIFAVFVLSACASRSARAPIAANTMLTDVDAFRARPDDATFERLHIDIQGGNLTPAAQTRLLQTLAEKDVPPYIRNPLLADLASKDLEGAVGFLRLLNVAAQHDSGAGSAQVVARTARLTWMLLAMRPEALVDAKTVDLSGMDLRSMDPAAGQHMNLTSAIFNNATLSSGTWSRDVLTGASFRDIRTTGVLECADCVWGPVTGTFRLSDNHWSL